MNEVLAARSLLNQVGLVYNSGMMSFSGFLVGIFHWPINFSWRQVLGGEENIQ
jgi:hypothetical protein